MVSPGGTVNVPSGTYAEKATLHTAGVTWEFASGAQNNLTGLAVPIQQAGVYSTGINCIWRGGRIYGSSGAAFGAEGANTKLLNFELDHNIQEGYIWHGDDGLIQGGSNHHNNESGQYWNGSEQGSGKAHAYRLVIDGVHVYDIGQGGASEDAGQGLWWDVFPAGPARNQGAVIKNCLIERVFYAGGMFEISVGGSFHDNTFAHCGTTPSGSGFWGSGLLISNSQQADIYNNLFAYNQSGVRVILQNRADRPGITNQVAVHDNTFIGNTHNQFAYDTDDAGSVAAMFGAGSGNVSYRNRFDAVNVYWKPSGTITTLSGVNALPGGGGSTILTPTEVTNILAAAGVSP